MPPFNQTPREARTKKETKGMSKPRCWADSRMSDIAWAIAEMMWTSEGFIEAEWLSVPNSYASVASLGCVIPLCP